MKHRESRKYLEPGIVLKFLYVRNCTILRYSIVLKKKKKIKFIIPFSRFFLVNQTEPRKQALFFFRRRCCWCDIVHIGFPFLVRRGSQISVGDPGWPLLVGISVVPSHKMEIWMFLSPIILLFQVYILFLFCFVFFVFPPNPCQSNHICA